jgi:hypothetical protein
MAVKWQDRWKVLADAERQEWALGPFVSVGPLAFGMTPHDVSQALSGVTHDSQVNPRNLNRGASILEEGAYKEFGLSLYYREERLAGLAVHARLGPQVRAEGVALVGQTPSVLEQWILGRAETRQPEDECEYMDPGIPGSVSLGVYINVQRAGDHLLTRPLFVSYDTMDDPSHLLPSRVWSFDHY